MIYPNAPIREAVLDIKVSGLDNKTFEDFQELLKPINQDYPNVRGINRLKGSLIIEANNHQKNEGVTSSFYGVIFSSKNQNKQVKFKCDGFTYNFLAPYTNWNDFRGESLKLWEMYFRKFPEMKIERMALRYINRIVIPKPFEKIEDFVENVPPIPKGLPKIYTSFFSQIQVPCEREDYNVLINSTIETPTSKETPFILDIEVFKEVKENFDFNDFDYIREIKNSIFESCITDKARQLFK